MAVAAFKSTTKREYQLASGQHRRTRSYSDFSLRYFSEFDSSSQRDSDQDSLHKYELSCRHLSSDSENETHALAIRQQTAITPSRGESPLACNKRNQTHDYAVDRDRGRSTARNQLQRRTESTESRKPTYTRGNNDDSYRQKRRSESQEPVARYRRSISREPQRRSESKEAVQRRSQSKEPVVFGRQRRSVPVFGRRGESKERAIDRRAVGGSKEASYARNNKIIESSYGPKETSPLRISNRHEVVDSDEDQTEFRTIRAVHSQLKQSALRSDPPIGDSESSNILDAMRAEVRRAVADLKTEIEESLEKGVVSNKRVEDVRKQYEEKLQQSEWRTKELLSQLADEEEMRIELAKLVKELACAKISEVKERQVISKALDEDAQRYFEEFVSMPVGNELEIDGDDEDEGEGEGGDGEVGVEGEGEGEGEGEAEIPVWKTGIVSVNSDGVIMPWLDWETETEEEIGSSSSKMKMVNNVWYDDGDGEGEGEAAGEGDGDGEVLLMERDVQRMRYRERVDAGRLHLCRYQF